MINVAACLTGPDAVPAEGEALICVIYNYDAPPAWQAVFTQLGADPGKWAAYRPLSDAADQPLPSWEGPGPAWPCPLPGPVLPGWEGVASRAFMSPRPLRGGRGFPGGSNGKEFTFSAGDWGSIPGSGIFPGEGNGNLLQYSCLENSLDRGTCGLYSPWGHKGRTRLSD